MASAQIDRFVQDRLPPPDQWPAFCHELPELQLPTQLNLVQALFERAAANGHAERPMLRSDVRTLSYTQAQIEVNRIANVLTGELGLVPGNRVLLRGGNSIAMALAWLAVVQSGLIAVATMPLLRARELTTILDKAQPSAALCDVHLQDELRSAWLSDTARAALPFLVFNTPDVSPDSLEALAQAKSTHASPCPTAASDIALLAFTSGTTGSPKAAVHSHGDVLAACETWPRHVLRATPDDIVVGSPPLAFTFGLGGLLIFPMWAGASVYFPSIPYTPEAMVMLIAQVGATICYTAPTFYRQMAPFAKRHGVGRLRVTVSAGEGLPDATRQLWKDGVETDINLRVDNNIIITRGILYTNFSDFYVQRGVNVGVNGTYSGNANVHRLYFNGDVDDKSFTPGPNDIYRAIFLDDPGSKLNMYGSLKISSGRSLNILNGYWDLNGNDLTFIGAGSNVSILGASSTFEVDAGATLTMGTNTTSQILNTGGNLVIVGTENNLAKITSSSSYDIIQTLSSAKISAQYYSLSGVRNNGLDIQDGSIDAVNNLSNGSFSNGFGNIYLNIASGVTIPNPTIKKIVFVERANNAPAKNIAHTAGTIVTLEDATGNMAVPSRETDDGLAVSGFVRWTYPGGIFWTGLAGDANWNTAGNWSPSVVPIPTSDVFLDHSFVKVAYTVNVNNAINTIPANPKSLTIINNTNQGKITLDMNGKTLKVNGDISIGNGNEIKQTNASDTIFIAGSYSNTSGMLNGASASVVFNAQSGNYTISTNSSTNQNTDFNHVFFRGGAKYALSDISEIEGNLTISGGTLNFGDATNRLELLGNLSISDSGKIEHAGADLYIEGLSGTQVLNFGGQTVDDIYFLNASQKTITSNLVVENRIFFNAGTGNVNAGENLLFVKSDWRNLQGNSVFTQIGNGTVIFNSLGTQYIGRAGDFSTTFNKLYLQDVGSKIINSNLNIAGDLIIQMSQGGNLVDLANGYTITSTLGTNRFLMSQGLLRLQGTNNFPSGFNSYELVGGEVRYESNGIDQQIFPTTYNNLRLRETGASVTNKIASGNITIEGSFNVDNSKTQVNMNCFNLILNGSLTMATGALPIDWGNACKTTCGSGGTLVIGKNIGGLDADFNSFHNLRLDNSGVRTFTLTNNITVEGNFEIFDGSLFDMRAFTVTNSCVTLPNITTFSMGNSTDLRTQVASGNYALPAIFGNYSIAPTSKIQYQLNGNQDVFTNSGTIIYGDLDLEGSGSKTLDGKLNVNGIFDMSGNSTVLMDNGNSMFFSGSLIEFETYAATVTSSTFFQGNDQIVRLGNANSISFKDVEFNGVGTKLFWDGDTYNFTGDFKVGANVIMDFTTYNQNLKFSGDSIAVKGIMNHDGGNNDFIFNKIGTQVVDLGSRHDIAHLDVAPSSIVQMINNGLNVTGSGGTQNYVRVQAGAILNLDTMTHKISQDNFRILGTLNSSNANLIFNSNGNQLIDAFTAQDIQLLGGGRKNMNGIWHLDDLYIDGGVTLDFNSQDSIVVSGNWISDGSLDYEDATVKFEITDTRERTIKQNSNVFAYAVFEQVGGNSALYTVDGAFYIDDSLRVGNGATLDLNGNDFYFGFPADGGSANESLVVESAAELKITNGSQVLFDGSNNLNANVDVYGTLTLVGTSSKSSGFLRNAGNGEIDIDIIGGTVAARYYSLSNLVDGGFFVDENSTINPINNFSDGSFSNMQQGVGAVYLHVESDVSNLINPIQNVNFNHTNPVVGLNFNVRRDRLDGGILKFEETISGPLGSYLYEKEIEAPSETGRIEWPSLSITNWIGGDIGGVNDWFIAANWDNGVPDTSKTAMIGVRPFPPIIENKGIDTAKCKNLKLIANSASLTIKDGIDLFVKSDLSLGTGILSTKIVVQNSGSDIIVGGNWFKNPNSLFVNGNATVKFLGLTGTSNIEQNDPDDSEAFGNVLFNSTFGFNIIGDLNVNGNITQLNGDISPKTNNYTIYAAGNWDGTGGSFTTSVNGLVILDGASQTITNAEFDQLTIAGSSCKTINGVLVVNDVLTVNSCLASSATANIDMNSNVIINASGTFNDGGSSHTFSGNTWTGTGAFPSNAGKISFDKIGGTQTINASKFNNLEFTGTSAIQLAGNVSMTKNLTINNSINRFYSNGFSVTNTTGVGTMTLGSNEFYYATGLNSFPKGFNNYSIAANSNTFYDGTGAQNIQGNVTYGNLYLRNNSTKTIVSGDIGVQGNMDIALATLDVSANNYNILLKGNWNNNNKGSFTARQGTVIFSGNTTQYVNPGDHTIDGIKSFYNVLINNTADSPALIDVNGADMYIDGSLNVVDGIFGLNGIGGGWNAYIGRSMLATGGGSFTNTGFYYLNSSVNSGVEGKLTLGTNGSTISNIIINSSANTIYQMQSDLVVDGNFDLLGGNVELNGKTATLGTDINDRVIIAGKISLNAGSELLLGNQTSLTVNNTGIFELLGSANLPARVASRYSNGDYNFTVNGKIAAKNYSFESMSSQGIYITSVATIDNVNNFSNGSFSDPAAGGIALRIENSQRFTTANGRRIENVIFTNNPGNGTVNVAKTLSAIDSVEFYNATGALSGENYENDPNGRIFWTGPRKMIWTGKKNTDWYDVANWKATSGPTQVPDSTLDVLIPYVTNLPKITVAGAKAKNMTIEAGAIVTVATLDNLASDLTVFQDLSFEGILSTSTSNDVIEVRGSWNRIGSGNYTYSTGGKVKIAQPQGTFVLNNGGTPFYDLEINTPTGTVFLATNVRAQNNLTIASGTLDVSSSNYKITIGNNFINNGTFKERNGEVELTTPNAINFNGAGTNFYNLTLNGTGTLDLISDLKVKNVFDIKSGVVNLNTRNLSVGDAIGTDLLKISGGTLNAGPASIIKMASNAGITVSSGGKLSLLGSSLANRAKITNQGGTGKYSISVGFNGLLDAKYYTIEHLSQYGLNFLTGGLVDPNNNLSYGTFNNGTPGGAFITFNNSQDLTGNDQIEYVEFAQNPGANAKNVVKTVNTGRVKFYYAFGPFQGEDYENDPFNKVFWDADMLWTGAVSTDWNNPLNWNPLLEVPIPGLLPTAITDVIIPNAATVPNNPILNVNGLASDLEILPGGLLTMSNDFDLAVTDSVIIQGILDLFNNSSSTVSLGGTWISNGTGVYNSGNQGRVEFNGIKGTQYVISDEPFCEFVINKAQPAESEVQTTSALDINCDLLIQAGVLNLTNVSHTINLAGNWINQRTQVATGVKNTLGAEIIFDGVVSKTITKTGVNPEVFNNITIAKTGGAKVSLNSNVNVLSNLKIENNAILDLNAKNLDIKGNWNNLNTVPSSGLLSTGSTISFTGSVQQSISHAGFTETFYNLVLNNTSTASALNLSSNLEVTNLFTQTKGIVLTNTNILILKNSLSGSYTGFNSTTFVNGNLRRYIANNTSVYVFPVAKGNSASDYFRIDIRNSNLATTSYLTASVKAIAETGNNIDSRIIEVDGEDINNVYKSVLGEVAIWTVTPDVQPTSGSYATDVYMTNFSMLSGKDDYFGILKRNDASTDYADWDDGYPLTSLPKNGSAGRIYNSGNGYARRSGWTSFSQFSIGLVTADPLPITLMSFFATHKEGKNEIYWTTSNEIDNDYFTVEKSTDGERWSEMTKIAGAGTSYKLLDYKVTDNNPYQSITYYRLKQTDYDGNFVYSRVIFVESNKIYTDVTLYPNPSNGEYIDVTNLFGNPITRIVLTDLLGKQIEGFDTKGGENDAFIRIFFYEKLASGQYIINLEYENTSPKTFKFIAE